MKKNQEKDFYHNYLFSKEDLGRSIMKKPWWEWPWLFLLPTYVQISDGYAYFFKQWGNQYYFVGWEKL